MGAGYRVSSIDNNDNVLQLIAQNKRKEDPQEIYWWVRMARTYCHGIYDRMEKWIESRYQGKEPVLMNWAGSTTLASMEYVHQAHLMLHRYVEHGPQPAREAYEGRSLGGRLRVINKVVESFRA